MGLQPTETRVLSGVNSRHRCHFRRRCYSVPRYTRVFARRKPPLGRDSSGNTAQDWQLYYRQGATAKLGRIGHTQKIGACSTCAPATPIRFVELIHFFLSLRVFIFAHRDSRNCSLPRRGTCTAASAYLIPTTGWVCRSAALPTGSCMTFLGRRRYSV